MDNRDQAISKIRSFGACYMGSVDFVDYMGKGSITPSRSAMSQ